jgi:hypothetical protein
MHVMCAFSPHKSHVHTNISLLPPPSIILQLIIRIDTKHQYRTKKGQSAWRDIKPTLARSFTCGFSSVQGLPPSTGSDDQQQEGHSANSSGAIGHPFVRRDPPVTATWTFHVQIVMASACSIGAQSSF